MADQPPEEIVAILFHRPSTARNPSNPTHLTPATTTAFLTLLQSLSSTPKETPPHTATPLDSPTHLHILRIIFPLPHPLTLDALRTHPSISQLEAENHLEINLQPSRVYNTTPRLAVFDMDSTLIRQEVIDLLAAHAGVEAQVSNITRRAMEGELDFAASLRERVRLLKGLDAGLFEELKAAITITPGAEILLSVLKKRGVKTALLSGGFMPLATWVGKKLGIDHVAANELAVSADGTLTGELREGCIIVDGARKRELLLRIAEEEGVQGMDEVVAVGDGANDLPMMMAAGLGVAVNAKKKVQREAPTRVNGEGALGDVLFLMGFTGDEMDDLAAG